MHSFRSRHILQLILLLVAGLLVACSSAPTILSAFFDIDPPPENTSNAPVVHSPRRQPFVDRSIAKPTKEYLALLEAQKKEPPPPNWAEKFEKLPKDDDGNIDWMAALKDKIIDPKPGIDPKTKDVEVDEDDEPILLAKSGKPERYVSFSHTPHLRWLNCDSCHPVPFKKDAGNATITMKEMDDGKYCGICHDKVAIAQPYGCQGCHPKGKNAPAKKQPS